MSEKTERNKDIIFVLYGEIRNAYSRYYSDKVFISTGRELLSPVPATTNIPPRWGYTPRHLHCGTDLLCSVTSPASGGRRLDNI